MNLTIEEALRIRSAELTARIYFRLQALIPNIDRLAVQTMLKEEADALDLEWFKQVQKDKE